MQHSVLQLYHKYNAMAINFLCIKWCIDTLYRNRTPDVPLTNRFVGIPTLSSCFSIHSVSGIGFLIVCTVDLVSCDCLVAGYVGKPATF